MSPRNTGRGSRSAATRTATLFTIAKSAGGRFGRRPWWWRVLNYLRSVT